MRFVSIVVAVLAAARAGGAGAVPPAGPPTSVEDCQSQLAALRADTVTAESSFTNEKSVTSAIGKLDAASAKLAEEKDADAVQKLVDFQTGLNSLAAAPKPKVDPDTAQSLVAEAQGVIDCIDAIGTA